MKARQSWYLAAVFVALVMTPIGCGDDEQEQDSDGALDSGVSDRDIEEEGDLSLDSQEIQDDSEVIDAIPDLELDTPSCALCTAGSCLAAMSGRVENEIGEPVAEAMAQLCVRVAPSGTLRCLMPSATGMDGTFYILIPESIRCLEQAVLRIVLPYAHTTSLYCEVALPESGGVVDIAEPLVLYETTPATTVPPEGDPGQVHTVVFEDGLEVDVIPERFWAGEEGYDTLASRHFGTDLPDLCFLTGAPAFLGLYGFSPEAEVDEPAFALRIPNHAGLEAGTAVDLYLLGGLNTTLGEETVVPEGVWQHYGEGTVNGAGTFIEVGPDPGLPHFLWLGYGTSPD